MPISVERYEAILAAHQMPNTRTLRRPGRLRAYFDEFACADDELLAIAEFAHGRWSTVADGKDAIKNFEISTWLPYSLGAAHATGVLPQQETDALTSRIGASTYVLMRWEFGRCETLERMGYGRKAWKTGFCRITQASHRTPASTQ
jgi:hypothetical protein